MVNRTETSQQGLTKEMGECLHRLVEHVATMQGALDLIAARSIAQEATLNALIATHSDPRKLFEIHAYQREIYEVGMSSESTEDFKKELRHFQVQILRAMNSGAALS